ncbi:DNA polymerase III subunit alpha [Paraliobacillus quinghaiensis]|uniref:DNA polymerase III subunit alpha n=1 Tax=Paraliobacillus quinghaiensis TaxID=470815 RepID=A0A917WT63_9BACI|nr:DNA polymerase III subunit alpha [Paraliobacillus quinghaiensis]GGM26613.1 DNA polymerase III subunit alpha [Paraliobacillus quinghaiensis]
MEFTHLHVRSGYSMMKSTIKLADLVKQTKEFGMNSVALTDENVLHGAVSFYKYCLNVGIKPIIGMVINLSENNRKCIVLAKNNHGYQSLLRLSSYIQLEGKGSIKQQELHIYAKDLFLIVPVPDLEQSSEVNKVEIIRSYLKEWHSSAPDTDIYLGIESTEKDNFSLYKEALAGIPFQAVAIGDARYLHIEDQTAYHCLRAIDKGEKWNDQSTTVSNKNQSFYESEVGMGLFEDWPEIVDQSNHIAAQCNVKLDLDQQRLPKYPLDQSTTAAAYLKKLCDQSLIKKYPNTTDAVRDRLDYELDIINRMQFSDYFLIVWDFIQYAKEQEIMVGPGRGSAAGSLVAYLLDITEVDPIRYDLLFERFLNPERVSMPDIDIDFSDHRRDEVIAYVQKKYGREHVAQIGTFGTFATRSVLRELSKTLNISPEDTAFILKEIPGQGAKSVTESLKAAPSLVDYVKKSEELQQLFKVARKLEGLPRHLSTHAAGVIISDDPLVDHVALTTGSDQQMLLTQFAMKDLEAVGLLKMDFLGLRNLTLIERIIDAIKRQEKKEIVINELPENDARTFALLQQGKTNGIFQLESQGMQRVLNELYPTSFEDIVAVNALYRPGPMEYISTYVSRKHGKETVNYAHPDLQSILKPTYGVLIYQEQIMQIANQLAGFSYGQADILRRAVSKKQKEQMEELKQQFIQGCLNNGYNQDVAEELFHWIIRFSNYGFNRSHAVAYSLISYRLAYLKAHYPAYFLADLLSSVAGQHDKTRLYSKEAQELGVRILQPSINKSFGSYSVENNNIRMGLWAIKGVGNQVVKEVLRVRKAGPFKHLFDFCLRVSLKIVNRPILEALIMAGAFDETKSDRAVLLATIDQALEQGELFGEFDDQPSFFHDDLELDVNYVEVEAFTTMQQLTLERELLGIYISSHPLSNYRTQLRSSGYVSLSQLNHMVGKNNRNTAAIIQQLKVIRTKRGDQMAFITLADEETDMEAVVFPDIYRQVKSWLKEEIMVTLTGKPEERQNKIQLLVSEISQFEESSLDQTENKQRLFIKIDQKTEQYVLSQMKKLANYYPGKTPVIVFHSVKELTYQLANTYNLNLERECLQQLYHTFGRDNVVVKN